MIRLIFGIILLTLFSSFSYSSELVINKSINYPYRATTDRAETISSEYKKINIGMSAKETIEILGTPDLTKPLIEAKIKNANQIGFTHWYLIQRLQENGSVNEKQEKLVRVSYDLNWKVIAIDNWGF